MYDLIIIGAGAAGCSAAIYAKRRELNFRIISQNVGGEVALSGQVGNWPGIIDIQGFVLANNFAEHVRSYGVTIEEGWLVDDIVPTENYHMVIAKNPSGATEKIETKAVIIATGIHPRRLSVPGEEELDHHGVTYCTVCDGPLYRNKKTVTIGAGNSALESALMMAEIAKPAYLLTKFPNMPETQGGFPKGDKILIDKVKGHSNIQIIYEAKTTEILGDKNVEAIRYQTTDGQIHDLTVDGVMVHIGMIPNSQFATHIKCTPAGEIITDTKCHTNVSGIFAAGDITNIPHKQIVVASGQGVVAALEAIQYINRWTK